MESSMELEEILLEFRAGRMFIEGTRVVPDTRKGLVRLGRNEGGLLHFQWLDRIQNIVEEDQIVFPEEGIFEKVTQSSERVYLLKFISDDRKLFFWMQEPKSDRDLQICNLVNFYLCQPLTFIGEDEAEASIPFQISEMSRDATDDDISSRAGNLFDHGMASELAGEVTSAAEPVKLEDLQRIIRSIQQTAAVEDLDGGLGLGDILKPDLVLPLIETLPLEQRLASYLPEGSWTPEAVMELLQSAPFRQQVDTFTQVIRTGQIDLSQFGIIDASKYKFTVLSFLEALDDSVRLTMEVRGTDESQRCSGSGSGSDPMDEK